VRGARGVGGGFGGVGGVWGGFGGGGAKRAIPVLRSVRSMARVGNELFSRVCGQEGNDEPRERGIERGRDHIGV